jgi:hypothetical protein
MSDKDNKTLKNIGLFAFQGLVGLSHGGGKGICFEGGRL